MNSKDTALEGIKVVDFGWVATAPLVARYLADFGATVVRIESSKRPDLTRISAPYKDGVPGLNRSGVFPMYNSSKYSIGLNLSHPEAIEVAKRLVSWADAVVEGFAAGVMDRLGLGYEELKKIKPDIVMLRTCNQGQTGPHANHPGTGLHLVGLAGFTNITGWPDRDAVQPFGGYTDFLSYRIGVTALLAALNHRRKTGKGQCLDMSQYEIGVHFMEPMILEYTVNGREFTRMGNSCPYAAPHGVYRCQGDDRWCAITVFTDKEWKAFGDVLGNPPWAASDRFATVMGRKKNEEALNQLVEEYTVNFAAEEVMMRMQEAGIAAGVVENMQDLFQDPQIKHREHFRWLNHTEMGYIPHPAPAFQLPRTPANPRAAPCLGEHTEKVCRDILGMSDEDFVRLLAEGVFD